MGITERLITIHENVDSVHEAGYNAGYQEGLDKGGYTEGFEAGKQDEYDAFWDALQQNGTRVKYTLGVCGDNWTKETFKPKYPIRPEGSIANCFAYWGTNGVGKDIDLRETCVLDTSKATNMSACFFNNSAVVGIGILDCTNATTMDQVFGGAINLVTIEKIILGSGVYSVNNAFRNCQSLTTISFEGDIGLDIDFQWSTLLSRASIESIITHLSSNVSGKTLTLSKTAVENAFNISLVDAETGWFVGDGIEEWLALIEPKSNWNFVFV